MWGDNKERTGLPGAAGVIRNSQGERMLLEEIANRWNAKADEHNQWGNLGGDEKIEFAYKLGHIAGQLSAADAITEYRKITALNKENQW
jgi:hypothetical protein